MHQTRSFLGRQMHGRAGAEGRHPTVVVFFAPVLSAPLTGIRARTRGARI